ncbi:MAG: putative bifunctional diguanylate cyclase/phosphodiesterase [Acidimicrobiales bacterium]
MNDRYGHDAGDDLLVQVSERLRALGRSSDIVGRIGGDEFAIASAGIGGAEEALELAERTRSALAAPMYAGRHTVDPSVTIGIALGSTGSTATRLVRRAEQAMHFGKTLGRNRCEVFDDEMQDRLEYRNDLEAHVREAIADGELLVFYQPFADATTGRIAAVEALARWDHPVHGLLAAAEFVHLAEDGGLIRDLDAWVLRRACTEAAAWGFGQGDPRFTMYVNLSARQVFDEDLLWRVRATLHETGLASSRLSFELTEHAAVPAETATLEVLNALRGDGIGLAIDDFGTGYAALGYLRDLPVTTIKLDKSFADRIETAERDRLIVATIAGMAKQMGILTVAEGVERESQLTALASLGVDQVQGFHISPPQPAEVIGALLAEGAGVGGLA